MSIPVSSSAEVRALDARTIETAGVPGLALMEVAGLAVSREIDAGDVVVLAGRGNNGGDGWVVARHLHLAGRRVRVCPLEGESSPDCAAMRAAAEGVGVEVVEAPPDAELVVDALLGTGLSSELRGVVAERVAWMHGRRVLAVDMPTGLCGDTGRVLGDCAPAEKTVTFERPRLGQLLEPGADLCGELVVAGIGLVDGPAFAEILEGRDLQLPARAPSAHKGSHGHVGVVAGSEEMPGAAVLACLAALRAGAGRVTLFCDDALDSLPPEVMRRSQLELEGFDALVVGPGLGRRRGIAERIWREHPGPAVFDADGLTALSWEPSAHPRALTPHPGEAARLLGWSSQEVQANRLGAVLKLSELAPTLLKGRHTLISGQPVRFNRTGGPMLATAGSGDVLAGLVGALLAQGLEPREALSQGAFVHGLAGEILGDGLVASELADALPRAMQQAPLRDGLLALRPLLP